MTDIKPKMVDGEARCAEECPFTEVGCNDPDNCTLSDDQCWPWYRARIATLEAERKKLVDDGWESYDDMFEEFWRQNSELGKAIIRITELEAQIVAVRDATCAEKCSHNCCSYKAHQLTIATAPEPKPMRIAAQCSKCARGVIEFLSNALIDDDTDNITLVPTSKLKEALGIKKGD